MKKRIFKIVTVLAALVLVTAVWVFAQNQISQSEPPKTVSEPPSASEKEEEEFVTPDDPWAELEKLVNQYYDPGGVAYKGTIRLIDDNGDEEKVMEENRFEYTVAGPRFRYRIGDMEVVCREDMTLVADHLNQRITVNQQDLPVKKTRKLFDISAFKKLMETGMAEARVIIEEGQKALVIENINDPQIQGYKIFYDSTNYRIHGMLIGMIRVFPFGDEESLDSKSAIAETDDTEPGLSTYTYYMEINYTEKEKLGIKWKDFHPESQFIRKEKNAIVLTESYTNYQLYGSGISSPDKQDDFE